MDSRQSWGMPRVRESLRKSVVQPSANLLEPNYMNNLMQNHHSIPQESDSFCFYFYIKNIENKFTLGIMALLLSSL